MSTEKRKGSIHPSRTKSERKESSIQDKKRDVRKAISRWSNQKTQVLILQLLSSEVE